MLWLELRQQHGSEGALNHIITQGDKMEFVVKLDVADDSIKGD